MKVNNTQAPIIFLMGPTASGKTALAIELYQTGQYEIISVDSAMVYTQLNIGSAKPTNKELVLAPHHLIDFIEPNQSYSASQFCEDAISLINEIHERGKIPLLVGGTMLYFKALKDGLAELPATQEPVRQQVNELLSENGLAYVYEELKKVDPQTASRLHINDKQRITRALEVYLMTSKPMSVWHAEQKEGALVNPLLSIALAPADRKILHQRIELRFDKMIQDGFLDEVAGLYKRGDLNLDCPSMRSVGYRQIWQYMDGQLSLSEAKEKAIIATRQLAKRQYTWLRSWPDIQWYDPTEKSEKDACISIIIQFENNP